jgi:hypothetical protein
LRKVLLLTFALLLILSAVSAYGQSFEQSIKNRIVSETKLDPDLVTVILYNEGGMRLMLTFVYINERTLQSNLKQDIKDAISPYKGQNAVLVFATAQGEVSFDPYEIYFGQHGFNYRVEPDDVIKITSDFTSGVLKYATSEGIVLLQGINTTKQFKIGYKNDQYSTSLALKQPAPKPQETHEQYQVTRPEYQPKTGYFWGLLKYAVVNLLMVLLLPVLVF